MKILFLIIALVLVGCRHDQTPSNLVKAEKPLTLVGKSHQGVLISDANGELYAYDETYFFAQNIIASGLENGDTLTVKAK
jgi:hypothetical protein